MNILAPNPSKGKPIDYEKIMALHFTFTAQHHILKALCAVEEPNLGKSGELGLIV
jgi:hypothetical protein